MDLRLLNLKGLVNVRDIKKCLSRPLGLATEQVEGLPALSTNELSHIYSWFSDKSRDSLLEKMALR